MIGAASRAEKEGPEGAGDDLYNTRRGGGKYTDSVDLEAISAHSQWAERAFFLVSVSRSAAFSNAIGRRRICITSFSFLLMLVISGAYVHLFIEMNIGFNSLSSFRWA